MTLQIWTDFTRHYTLVDLQMVTDKNRALYTKWRRITHYQTLKSFRTKQTHAKMNVLKKSVSNWYPLTGWNLLALFRLSAHILFLWMRLEYELADWLSTLGIETVLIWFDCVSPWCSFVLLLASVSVAMMLCWYGYANKNNNSNSVSYIQMLSYSTTTCCYRTGLYYILWGSSRNVGSWNVRLYSMLLSVDQQYIVIFRMTCISQQHNLVSARTFSMFSTNSIWCVYVLHTARKSHWQKNCTKSDLSGQTETDFQKCDLNRISNPHLNVSWNRWRKNRIWTDSLKKAIVWS